MIAEDGGASCLLFDLDDTLLNTSKAILLETQALLGERGDTTPTVAELRDHRREYESLPRAVERVYGLSRSSFLAAVGERVTDNLSDHLRAERIRPYPGAAELVERLAADRYRLGLVTNATRSYAERTLEAYELDAHFEVIVAADDVDERKPAPLGIERALSLLSVGCDDAVYVGDSRSDYLAAREANVEMIQVRRNFEGEHSPHVVSALEDVYELVR